MSQCEAFGLMAKKPKGNGNMVQPVQINDKALRPLFVRVIDRNEPQPAFMGDPDHDAQILLYMPDEGSHKIDTVVLTTIAHQVKQWGFRVTESTRVLRDCGVDKVLLYTLRLASVKREPEKITAARAKLDGSVLNKLVQARHHAAGTAEVEEFFLDDTHIATRIILTVDFGTLRIDERLARDLAANGLMVELCDPNSNHQYMFPVSTILEHEETYDPAYTAAYGAQSMGLFLTEEIDEPTRTTLYRDIGVIEVDA